MTDIQSLLASYPRKRPPLTPEHQAIYEKEYKLNREGERVVEGLSKRLEGWMHSKIATKTGSTLELGAGTLNHLKYEKELDNYDIVEPFLALYEDSKRLELVGAVYTRTSDISDEKKYERIISIAVLEHITDLPRELALCCRHLENKGVFQAGIPSEGGFLWWLGWRSTTGISYWLRNRLNYGTVMKHEHVNTSPEIINLVKFLFSDVVVRRFPMPLFNLSLYAYIEARNPIDKHVTKLLSKDGFPS